MIKKWFGNLVSVVTLIFFLQYFDVETAAEHIKSFNMTVFLLSMFVILLGVVVKAYRWVWINNHHFTLSKSFKAYVMSIVLNALLPLRAGDVYRVSVFNGLFKTKIAFLIARMVREKLFDLMTVLMIFHIALMFVESRIAHDLDIYYHALLASIVSLALLLNIKFITSLKKLLNKLESRKIKRLMLSTLISIEDDNRSSNNLLIIGLSLISWFVEAIAFVIIANQLDFSEPVLAGLLAFSISTLALALPSAPGGIGIFHLGALFALSIVDVPSDDAAVFSVITHAAYMVLFFIIFIWHNMVRFSTRDCEDV